MQSAFQQKLPDFIKYQSQKSVQKPQSHSWLTDLHTFQNFFPLRSNLDTSSTNYKDSNDQSPLAKKQNQSEARDRDRNCAKLMAATRKFLLYTNTFSEQTYVHEFNRIRKTKFCFQLFEVLYNGPMRLIRSQFTTGCN